jgi:O-acetylhomoserine/O-acetylserine sulfhydrylase-like pyridoxal-dependent enzyme
MKLTNMRFIGLWAGILLTFCSFGVYAAESHMVQSLKHAEAAAKATDAKAITEHAESAKSHVTIAEEHLKAGATSLDEVIEHGKQGHADLAKKSAEEAVTHLKAAQ